MFQSNIDGQTIAIKTDLKQRIGWVSIAKGLTIMLMVIGHTSIPAWFSNWIWSFHMPFFFIISAMMIDWHKGSLYSFFIRKSKSLLIPFIIYSAINLMTWPIVKGCDFIIFFSNVIKYGWGG